jgi:hypothetical protein
MDGVAETIDQKLARLSAISQQVEVELECLEKVKADELRMAAEPTLDSPEERAKRNSELQRIGLVMRNLATAETIRRARNIGEPPVQKLLTRPRIRVKGLFSLLMDSQVCESFMGDLQERYGLMLAQKGPNTANRWYYREVILSFFSLAFDALKRVFGIEKLYRRIGL